MRHAAPARIAPRRIEVQHQHFAFEITEDVASATRKGPAEIIDRRAFRWRHGIRRVGRRTRDRRFCSVTGGQVIAVTAS